MPNVRPENGGKGGSHISVIVDGKWDCNVCGIIGNWASRARCRRCGGYGPKAGGGGGKGGGGNSARATGNFSSLGDGARSGGGAGGFPNTYAQRQLQRERDDLRLQKQREESKKREDALRAANHKLQRDLATARMGIKAREEDDEDDMDDDEETEEERQRKIEATQKAIPYLIIQHGEESAEVAKARSSIEDMHRASREAKPYKTHRGQLERKLERLKKQQEKARNDEEELLQEIESAQGRLNKLRAANDERDKTISAVDDELKDLLRRAIAEGEPADAPPAPPPTDPSAAWNTVNETLASMVAQPGVPQEWAAQLGGLLEQVRLAAIAIQKQSGMPPPTPAPRTAATSSSTTASSPSPPPPPSPPPAGNTQTPTAATTTVEQGATNRWASRVHDLAFADGGGAAADQQPGAAVEETVTNQAAASAIGTNNESDHETDDDDMASVVGDDLERKGDESALQHKRRIARLLKERAKKRKEDKHKEGRADKKKSEAKDGKDKVNQKKN